MSTTEIPLPRGYCRVNLKDDLRSAGFHEDYFNSNNSWGFGGASGEKFTRDGVVVKIATAYSRHIRPVDFITVTVDGRRIFDEVDTSKNAQHAFRLLVEIGAIQSVEAGGAL